LNKLHVKHEGVQRIEGAKAFHADYSSADILGELEV